MKQIPLNFLTLYADLQQSLSLSNGRGGTIAVKTVHGKKRLYAVERQGSTYKQKYIGGAGDPAAQSSASRIKRAAEEAKVRKSTVSALKRARIPAPDLYMGRLLEVLAEAGIFEAGGVLVGTGAYQLYPCLVGAFLMSGLMTKDADLAVPPGAALVSGAAMPLEDILRRADPSFEARMNRDHKWPQVFVAQSGFQFDVLTTVRRTKGQVHLKALAAAAAPLHYLEYLIDEPVEAVALYGSGVLVKVPQPARYAIHKLIVSGLRSETSPKRQKDLLQSADIFDALEMREPGHVADAIEDARSRGPKWRKLIDQGLKQIGRGVDGLPLVKV